MDTPGHVDFAYEVSRSLAACEGSLLVVDASQGVEAQTLANAYHAIEVNHEIIPVLNKIDLPSADPERVCKEIEDVIGIDTSDAVRVGQDRPRHRRASGGDGQAPAGADRRSQRAPEGAAGRQLVRPLSRRRHPGARQGRRAEEGPAHPHDGGRRRLRPRQGRRVHAQAQGRGRARPGRDRLHHRRHQDHRRLQGGRHHHRRPQARDRDAGGLQALGAGGVLRPVPGRCRRVRAAARIAQQAAAERLVVPFRAGVERRPGLRLPLRLPGPAASRDRAGAAGARVRPRPRHHRALRRLQAQDDRRHGDGAAQSGRLSRPDEDRRACRSRGSRPRS